MPTSRLRRWLRSPEGQRASMTAFILAATLVAMYLLQLFFIH